MAGVIIDGIQWERCNKCAAWVKIDNLGYIIPTEPEKYGMDICAKCVDAGLRGKLFKFSQVVPAKDWKRVIVNR